MNSGAVQAGLMPFRNALINGDMRINQRGTSTNLASLTGVATVSPGSWATDRWNVYRDSFAAGSVIGQGTNLTNADLPFSDAGIKTFGRIGRLNGNTGTNNIRLNYNIESQDCYQYVGKVVTLSFYYRTGTNFSGSTLITNIFTGTGTDQAIRSNYTGSIVQATTNIPSLIWRRVSFTVTLSSLLNQIGLDIQYTPVGTAGANDYFDITGIQLELGSVPTSFEVRPFSVELQSCMRYCQVIGYGMAYGAYYATTASILYYYFPVVMRIIPNPTFPTNLTNAIDQVGVSSRTIGSFSSFYSNTQSASFIANIPVAGTFGNPSAYIGPNIILNAEM